MKKPVCSCGNNPTYVEKHDAYACLICNKWLDNKCSDNKCEFCSSRSEKPFKD